MSKIVFQGNDAGTGSVTLKAPNTNVDRVMDIPDEVGKLITDASDLAAAKITGNIAAARITTALNAGGSAPMYACRAWVNFNGTGTVAIRASGNVSSITDNGVGDYTVNFATAMPDADYSSVGATGDIRVVAFMRNFITTTSTRLESIYHVDTGAERNDQATMLVAIFR